MKRSASSLVLVLVVLAAVPSVWAQGFKPFELGARAAGLGGAFVARADDASAVYFNPAGLAFQPGLRLKIDISYNVLSTTAEIPGLVTAPKSKSPRFIGQPYVGFNYKDFIAVGIGIFSANTMRNAWPSVANVSYSPNESLMTTTYFRPVLAVKPFKFLALGAGLDYIQVRQSWDRDQRFTFGEDAPWIPFTSRIKTNVEGSGTGFVAGWLFKPSDRLRFGGKYTSRVDIDLVGKTDFDSSFGYTTPVRDLPTRAKMAMPEEIVVGLMVAPLERLAVHLDYQRIGMSGAMDWMFDSGSGIPDAIQRLVGYRPLEDPNGAGLALKDTKRLMGGIEYILGKALAVRAGYSRLESSVDDANLRKVFPDLATEVYSFGIGYEGPFFDLANREKKMGGLSVDALVQYGRSPGRQSYERYFPALYKGNRLSVGVGFGFVF